MMEKAGDGQFACLFVRRNVMQTKNTMTQIFFVMLTVLGTVSLLSRSDA